MPRELPGSYAEMYPGRFLKADGLKGKKHLFTITGITGDDLIGENSKTKAEWIVTLAETKLELVLNKTNAFCLYRMFGGDPHSWIGHKIAIYPTKTKFGKEDMDCIRIWGSPDIAADMEITVPQGRKKRWETVMHAVGRKPQAAAVAASTVIPEPARPAVSVDPRILTAWEVLGWTPEQGAHDMRQFVGTGAEYIVDLNGRIDQANAAA
jgi:hypothetical protein